MNSKITTNSQLSTNEPKKIKERKTMKTKTKQTRTGTESEKWISHGVFSVGRGVTEQTWGGKVNDILLPKGPQGDGSGPPFSPGVPPHLLGSLYLLPEKRHLSMPETGEKERNYLFKSYTDLE